MIPLNERPSLVLALLTSALVPVDPRAQTETEIAIPTPDAAAAEVPAGYRVDVELSGLMYPSSIAFDDAETMYVAECGYVPGDTRQPARILKISKGGEGGPVREVVATDLSAPITDLLWHAGRLYVSHRGKISVLENGELRDLVTDLPSFGDHSNGSMAVGRDGKLYFGQGSATNSGVVGIDNFRMGWLETHPRVCDVPAKDVKLRGQTFETENPLASDENVSVKTSAFQPFGTTVPPGTVVPGALKANGTILRMNPDGSKLEQFAWGFRNPYGLRFGPDGRLFCADAGSDERGSRQVRNEPEKIFVVENGAWYGWPDFLAGTPATDPRYKPKSAPPPEMLLQDPPTARKPWKTLEPHASLTQLDFSRSDEFGFKGQMFLASSGDQSEVTSADTLRAGYWVKRIDPGSGAVETFFRAKPSALGQKGQEYVATAGPKRLVDLCFSRRGDAMYVVDIGPILYTEGEKGPEARAFPGTGVIWRITRAGT
jgi:glucose/arabinose dehydrogenase